MTLKEIKESTGRSLSSGIGRSISDSEGRIILGSVGQTFPYEFPFEFSEESETVREVKNFTGREIKS